MKHLIKSFKLTITWTDGKTEGLAGCLPDYIYDELEVYLRELEDLREEHDADLRDEAYTFVNPDDSKELT
jgi:hypothetical protein